MHRQKTIRVVPTNPAVLVPYPDSAEKLPVEGADVPFDSYWRRRLADNSVKQIQNTPQDGKNAKGSNK